MEWGATGLRLVNRVLTVENRLSAVLPCLGFWKSVMSINEVFVCY